MNKIFLVFILFFLFAQIGSSQSNIYIGINAAPSLTFPQTSYSILDLNEEPNFSIGFSGIIFLNNQIFIKTGINYNRKSFSLGGVPDTRGALVNGDGIVIYDIYDPSARIDLSRIRLLEITEAFYSISMPVIVNYKFSDEGASFIASAGFEAAYLYNLKGFITPEGAEEIWNEKLNQWTSSISAGFGWYQPLAERFLFIVMPKYSYDFYPDWNQMDFNFQTISLSFGCYFY
jgi:hypothetical protein